MVRNIRIEMFSFGDIKAMWRFVVIASHDVVDVADTSRSHSDFGEVYRPNTSVGIL